MSATQRTPSASVAELTLASADHRAASFGRKAVRQFSYAVLFKNIEAEFKAPTYFIPISRFDELVDFLHGKIERTILGKRNSSRGHHNFETFDEFLLEQTA